MECRSIALAVVASLALVAEVPAQQGSSGHVVPGPPAPDPLVGNHTCETAFDLVPGIYAELSVIAWAPDYFRLHVPPSERLHIDLNVREWTHDFTVEIRDACNGTAAYSATNLQGSIPISLVNDTSETRTYMFRLFRDVGFYATEGRVEYDLMIAEGSRNPYPNVCSGDQSIAHCPCWNQSGPDVGCTHSLGHGGRLLVDGSQFSDLGGLTVQALDLPPHAPAMLFSSAVTGDVFHTPFRNGIFCRTGGAIVRQGARIADALGGASWTGAFDPRDDHAAGELVLVQVWFRDTEGPCGSDSNFTQAVRLRVMP